MAQQLFYEMNESKLFLDRISLNLSPEGRFDLAVSNGLPSPSYLAELNLYSPAFLELGMIVLLFGASLGLPRLSSFFSQQMLLFFVPAGSQM